MLRKWGIAPEEIQVLQVGASPVMVISLQKGGLDGAMLQDPSFLSPKTQDSKTLGDPAAMDIHYLQNVIAATRGYLRVNRDLTGRFIRGFVEGIAYYKKNKDESIKILMKKCASSGATKAIWSDRINSTLRNISTTYRTRPSPALRPFWNFSPKTMLKQRVRIRMRSSILVS